MKSEQIKLSQVKVNAENPRTITTDKFNKLVSSILIFPKMLELRPVVVDKTYKALGGNMRTQALNFIAKMSINAIQERLNIISDYQKLATDEKASLIQHWAEWINDPTCIILRADTLSAAEKEQFIIKDNVAYGAWDFDALANKFDNMKLGEWGMDVWQMPSPSMQPEFGGQQSSYIPQEAPSGYEDDGVGVPQNFNEVLDNLKQDSFVGAVSEISPYFEATFLFPKEQREMVESYFRKNGKDALIKLMLDEIQRQTNDAN